MAFRKNFLIIILIISFLGGLFAYKASATDWATAFKIGWDTAVKAAVQGAFQAVANEVVGKIQNSGIDGGPAFVQNWRNFQLQAQYRGEDIWRGLLYIAVNGDGNVSPVLCSYIRKSQAFNSLRPTQVNNLLQSLSPDRRFNNLQEYLDAAECDPIVEANYTTFSQNFTQGGGWDTWERMLQPQNNIFGSIELAMEELAKQRELEEKSSVNKALAGGGILGVENCLVRGINGSCLVTKIKTPGSILGGAVESVFDTNLKFYTTAEGTSGLITFAAQWLTQKLFDLGGSGDITTATNPKNLENSYKNEFCTVADNMSTDPAALWILANYPEAYANFPPEENIALNNPGTDNDVGKSFCERQKRDDNRFPYTRCVDACFKAVGLYPNDVIVPARFTEPPPPPPSGGGGQPGPLPPEPPSLLGSVQTERGNYGTPMTPDELSSLLNAVAWNNQSAGWGLLSKPSGNNCPFASGPIACDILFHKPTKLVYDVLIDSDNQAIPTWNLVGPENDLSRWFAPVQP